MLTIISGASRGIGKAITEDLRKTIGGEFILLSSKTDFNFPNQVYGYVSNLLEGYEADQINVILCAAQIGKANYLSIEEVERLYRINVLGNLAVINAALNTASKLRIVWFAGGGAAFPYPEFFGYSLSKVAVVRAVENLSLIINKKSSIIALAPGAVETDMLKTVLEAGCEVRTRTDISEPVNFVRKFITDEFNSLALNGMFLHVRDDLSKISPVDVQDENTKNSMFCAPKKDIFKLRRIE